MRNEYKNKSTSSLSLCHFHTRFQITKNTKTLSARMDSDLIDFDAINPSLFDYNVDELERCLLSIESSSSSSSSSSTSIAQQPQRPTSPDKTTSCELINRIPKRRKLADCTNVMHRTNHSVASVQSNRNAAEKRNERERRRVRHVNDEFERLRHLLAESEHFDYFYSQLGASDCANATYFSSENESSALDREGALWCLAVQAGEPARFSKHRTLRLAASYIAHLSHLLQCDETTTTSNDSLHIMQH